MHPVLSIVIPLASSNIADAISPGLGLVGCLAAGAMVLALWCYTKVRAATKKDAPKAAPASEQLPNAPNPAPEPT
ncbi:MAG: hypothetical protein Q4B54_06700, partial [Coriobacteriales bacterium]|nr:hypothetical protein [Coriobacteriales bacterium]